MCKHKIVDMPLAYSGKTASRDHILRCGIGNLQVPFDVGTFRKLKERAEGAKTATYCCDAVFNPFIVNLFMDDEFCQAQEQFRPYVMGLALNRIEQSIGVKLSVSKVKLVKKFRYKDGLHNNEDNPRPFIELPEDTDGLVDPEAPKPPPPPAAEPEPLIEDISPPDRNKKPAVKKGFLNKNKAALYPEGSREGVLPENAGDPMGWMPKKLRQTSKIVDCNSPEWQAKEKERKAVEQQNSMKKEFNDTLTKDFAKFAKLHDKWGEDLPDGNERPNPKAKYDNDYSRFKDLDDEPEETGGEQRDWYYDTTGKRVEISKDKSQKTEQPEATAASNENSVSGPAMKKGFLDNAKQPLYPKGSEQRAPATDEQVMRELGNLLGPDAGATPQTAPKTPSVSVKTQEQKAPEFTVSETPEGLQLSICVPGLESMKGVDLDVTERHASFKFPSGAGLRPLEVALPKAVLPASTRAKFSKKTHQITVTLPGASPAA